MGSSISEDQRKAFEQFIADHEPYSEEELGEFTLDGPDDNGRGLATIMKKLLDGTIK